MAGFSFFCEEEETAPLNYNINDWQKRTKALAFLFNAVHHFVSGRIGGACETFQVTTECEKGQFACVVDFSSNIYLCI